MNILALISYIATCSFFFAQDESSAIITLTYHHGVKLDKIQEPGNRYVFKQLCTTAIDSVISSGNIIMERSKIGKIKNCNYQWQIREDTLRAVVIETNNKKNTKQVILQATSQFGSPTEIQTTLNTTYEWSRQKVKSEIKAKLIMDKEHVTGIMTITN